MRYDLVVRGGLVASHESSAFIELGITNGRVVAVGEDSSARAMRKSTRTD